MSTHALWRAPSLAARLLLSFALAGVPAAARAQDIALKAPPQSARVFARDGSLIAELGPQVRTWVPFRSLPSYVPRTFVAVEDVAKTAATCRDLGGRVYVEATPIPGMGAFAILADPSGATFGVFASTDC